jgi:Tol biopolymer transport system component
MFRRLRSAAFIVLLITSGLGALPRPSLASPDPAVVRASLSSAGAQSSSDAFRPALSADGLLVAFDSLGSEFVANDTNLTGDIFVRNLANNTTARVSVASNGAQSDGNSLFPAISGDGRFVAFESRATNLAAGDTNTCPGFLAPGTCPDVFVHDRQTGATARISVSSNNTQADGPSGGFASLTLSFDGRFIAFTSAASNLVAGDTNNIADIFVRDRDTDRDGIFDEPGAVATVRVSVASSGAQANGPTFGSDRPSLSANGRFVAFHSDADNLVTGDANNISDVFVHDRDSDGNGVFDEPGNIATTRVSLSGGGAEGNNGSFNAFISANGRFVAFQSGASNLVAGDDNALDDVFLHDRSTGATVRVSVAANGAQSFFGASNPALSPDARYVAFESFSADLVPGDTNDLGDIFVRDLIANTTLRANVTITGTQADNASTGATFSANGCGLAYQSAATNLVAGDTNGAWDVFVRGGDRDGDALCDEWETNGIDYNRDGTIDLPLQQAPFNANPNHMDVFVEIDWMAAAGHAHAPDAGGLQSVRTAFANAPVANPDGNNGITLHTMTDESMPEIAAIWFDSRAGANNDFHDLKTATTADPCDGRFGTALERGDANCANRLGARRLAFHYLIFGHDHRHQIGSSGIGEQPGNDFMVTLGSWDADDIALAGGQSAAEASTFMHELGHNLGLGHGGGDQRNCKPNYLSVMSYSFQFPWFDNTRPLDYSTQQLPGLNENGGLNEPAGVGGPAGRQAVYGVAGVPIVGPANGPLDWNGDGDATDLNVTADVNWIAGLNDCDPSAGQALSGFNDWPNLTYNFRASGDFDAGVSVTPHSVPAITADQMQALARRFLFLPVLMKAAP